MIAPWTGAAQKIALQMSAVWMIAAWMSAAQTIAVRMNAAQTIAVRMKAERSSEAEWNCFQPVGPRQGVATATATKAARKTRTAELDDAILVI